DVVEQKITTRSWNIPNELQKHLDEHKIELDEAFLKLIPDDVKFKFGGSYYSPGFKSISVGQYKNAWQFKNAFYHEAGHAIDHAHSFCKNKKTNALMAKYINEYGDAGFKKMHEKINKFNPETQEEYMGVNQVKDTLMSLSIKYGAGHT